MEDETDIPQMDTSMLPDMNSLGREPSELDKVLIEMLKPENLHHLTELNTGEITAFSTLGVLAKEYDITIVKQWIVDNLKLRVSKQRQGRKEFVKITARNAEQFPQGGPERGPWNMFRRA